MIFKWFWKVYPKDPSLGRSHVNLENVGLSASDINDIKFEC